VERLRHYRFVYANGKDYVTLVEYTRMSAEAMTKTVRETSGDMVAVVEMPEGFTRSDASVYNSLLSGR